MKKRSILPIILACSFAAPAMAQDARLPADMRASIAAEAEAHLESCSDPRSPVCKPARELFLMFYPQARLGREKAQRKVAELLAEGPTPPIRRNPIEACAWTGIVAAVNVNRSADGGTVSAEDREVVTRRCLRLPRADQAAAQRRAQELLAQMTADLRRLAAAPARN